MALITQRSLVQIQPPQPNSLPANRDPTQFRPDEGAQRPLLPGLKTHTATIPFQDRPPIENASSSSHVARSPRSPSLKVPRRPRQTAPYAFGYCQSILSRVCLFTTQPEVPSGRSSALHTPDKSLSGRRRQNRARRKLSLESLTRYCKRCVADRCRFGVKLSRSRKR